MLESVMSGLVVGGPPFARAPPLMSVVVLFADLRGFTRLTERTQVDGVVSLLNDYFAVMTEAAYRHDGTIFSMAGDNLLVRFTVPLPQPDAAARAWRAAHEMAARP